MIYNNPLFSGFKQFFKDRLSLYLKQNDSYKDVNDEGLFERYMALFGEYIDTDMAQNIDEYLNIIDSSVCEEQYLTHLSDVLGNPPDVFRNVDQYRNLLAYIVSVYKIKGTKKAYRLFFAILGFNIDIVEIDPYTPESNYDQEGEYDGNQETDLYDQNICIPCSYYEISFYHIDPNQDIDQETILLLMAAIDFNEPINAKLKGFTMVINLEDSMTVNISEEVPEITSELIPAYDVEHLYDDEYIPTLPSCEVVTGLDSGNLDNGDGTQYFAFVWDPPSDPAITVMRVYYKLITDPNFVGYFEEVATTSFIEFDLPVGVYDFSFTFKSPECETDSTDGSLIEDFGTWGDTSDMPCPIVTEFNLISNTDNGDGTQNFTFEFEIPGPPPLIDTFTILVRETLIPSNTGIFTFGSTSPVSIDVPYKKYDFKAAWQGSCIPDFSGPYTINNIGIE